MAEAPQEIDNAMPAVPSQQNPPPNPNNYSFYLKLKPLRTLKRAIEVLLDPNFNNDGFGMVAADNESLAISVTNNDNATATLLLRSAGMIEFQNYAPPPPMIGMLTPLHLISQSFPRNLDGDDATVTIFRVQETDRLCFDFGTAPPTGFWVKVVRILHVTMFPQFTVDAATPVPAEYIREMIDYTLQAQDLTEDTVLIDWKQGFATFEIGSKKWEFAYNQNEYIEPAKLINWQTYQAQFNWSYTRLLKDASFLTDLVGVDFLRDPEQHVLFKFHMGELADLLLIKNRM